MRVLVLLLLAACAPAKPAPVVPEVASPCRPALDEGTQETELVYRGEAKEARVVGDFLPRSFYRPEWDPTGIAMTRDGDTWRVRLRLHPAARFDYQIVVDGVAAPDPTNPRTILSGYGGDSSELVLPEHTLPREIEPRADVARGTLVTVDEPWATPKITVYLPPGYTASNRYPTLYTADGSAWRDIVRLPTILDNLIADGDIVPVVAVMIDAAEDRAAWYMFNPAYLAYLERVVAYVDSRWSTQPTRRVHAGTSAGARASLQVGLARPELFAGIALLSPSVFGPPHLLEPYLRGTRATPRLDVFVSTGIYEGAICEDARMFGRWLGAEPLLVRQGHSFGNWRAVAPAMLRHFFVR